MSLKNMVGVVAFGSAVALALYGVGCGSSSPGGGAGSGGAAGSGKGGSTGSGSGGTTGSGSGGSHGSGSGGTTGISPFPDGGSDAGSCKPGSLAGFTPGLNTSGISAGMCTNAEIATIVTACFLSTSTETTCGALTTAEMTCLHSCIVTDWTSATSGLTYAAAPWGALIAVEWGTGTTAGIAEFNNVGGCYAAAAPTNPDATKCETDYQEAEECFLQACATNCPLPAQSSSDYTAAATALQNCIYDVIPEKGSGICSSYGTAVNTDCAVFGSPDAGIADSGAVGACNDALAIFQLAKPTDAQLTHAYNEFFGTICGTGPGDGG
jgi:hypothetical protein